MIIIFSLVSNHIPTMIMVIVLLSSPQSSSDPDCILIQRHCGTWWKGEKVSSSIFPLLDLISFSFSFIFNLSWIRKFLSAWQQWLVCLAKELFRHFWVMIDSAIYAERGYWPIAMHRISIFDQNADQRVKTLLIWEFINVGFNNVEVLEGINVDERVLGFTHLKWSNVTSIKTLQQFDRTLPIPTQNVRKSAKLDFSEAC